MSSNLTFQPQSPASSSTSSLDDQVNNPAARVYFGPIQSPERILIAKAAHRQNNLSSLPVRRSPRLSALQSSPKPPISLEEGERVVGVISGEQMGAKVAPITTTTAPDEDCFQDDIELEPPSALATKISRAHDNPSPPPKMQPFEPGCDHPTFPTSTDRRPPSSPTLKASSSAIAVGLSPRVPTLSPDPSQAPRECFASSLDRGPTASLPVNISTDLIVFDDGNFSDVPRAAPIVQPFPDLLAPTPIRESAHFSGGLESTLSGTRVCSPEKQNEELEQNNVSPSKAAATLPALNPPTIESPIQFHCSPRFSQPGSPYVHPSQNGPTLLNEVDPSDNLLQPVTCASGKSTPTVETEPSRPSSQVRQLRSLSPVSEGVLHNLLSTTEAITTAPLHQIPTLVSVFPANQLSHDRPSTPERISSPVAIHNVQRPPPERSPWRSHIANAGSPNKFAFNNTLRDPSRTPARRIPIREAIAQGSASPRKVNSSGPSTGIFGLPVFTRDTPTDRARSPVRCPPSDTTKRAAMPSSGVSGPTAPASAEKVRSGSEEPPFSRKPHLARPFLRSASDSEISSPSKPRRIPTFSVRPGIDARLPCTIPEEQGSDSSMQLAPAPLLKSELRQPSSMSGSRIPRIGAKPYARPPGKEKQQGKGKEPVHKLLFMARRPTSGSAPTKPVRLVKSVNTTGGRSSSEDLADSNAVDLGAPSSPQTNTSALPQSSPSLKRKRSPEEILSPPASQPTFARLVTSVSKSQQKPSDSGGMVKKARVGHVRRVGGNTATQKRAARSLGMPAAADETASAGEQPRTCPSSPPSQSQVALPATPLTPPIPHTTPEQPTSPSAQAEPASSPTVYSTFLSPELDEGSSNPPVEGSSLNGTRVTRSRRTPQPTSDVFGAVRPLQQRRRRPTEPPGESTFSSMSATALKALTTSNTTKNQHNLVAVFETEVIRKPGNRPGSPTTRVRTIEEKRKLEQGNGRRERAERRARRASEPLEDSSLTSEDEESLPLGPNGQPLRHRRGPGDEEDYESPERIERPEKKVRIHEAGEPGEQGEVKTVRWDRGLCKTIYFDDLPLQSATQDKQQTPAMCTRGALARSAKALRLDSLGNLVNATSLLKDLVQENVIIKKFVYDDDAEAAELDSPKPPSKGKGRKSKG